VLMIGRRSSSTTSANRFLPIVELFAECRTG